MSLAGNGQAYQAQDSSLLIFQGHGGDLGGPMQEPRREVNLYLSLIVLC